MGLRLKEQKGPRHAPHPWSQRTGECHLVVQQASWTRVGGENVLLSFPSSCLGGPLLPASPDLPGRPPMLPRTYVAWRGLWRAGDRPGSSAGSPDRVGRAATLCSSPALPREPSCLPLLIFPASGALILSGLHFSSSLSPPASYWFPLGFLSSPWASESSTSCQQAP